MKSNSFPNAISKQETTIKNRNFSFTSMKQFSIDINKIRDILATVVKTDTGDMIESIGAWSSELKHEVRMRDKYESLRNSDNMECPTCPQAVCPEPKCECPRCPDVAVDVKELVEEGVAYFDENVSILTTFFNWSIPVLDQFILCY